MSKIQIANEDSCKEQEENDFYEEIIPFYGKICDTPLSNAVEIPGDVEAISIELDGRIESTLDWSSEIELAEKAILKGLKILWKLNLGLFASLPHPLTHEGQLQSLRLSLQHFYDLIWERFKRDTVGVQIYHGELILEEINEGGVTLKSGKMKIPQLRVTMNTPSFTIEGTSLQDI